MRKNEVKLKLILIVISIIIIVFIIINNFIGGSGRIGTDQELNGIKGDRIEKAEAMRYFSFLFYSREDMRNLTYAISQELLAKEQAASEYANALYTMGVINENSNPDIYELDKNLTCGEYRDLLWATVDLLGLDYRKLSAFLPQRLTQVAVGDELLKEEFLLLYQAMIDQINDLEGEKFFTKKLYLLAQEENESKNVNKSLQKWITQEESSYYVDSRYVKVKTDDYIEAIVSQDEVLIVNQHLKEKANLNNVYLIQGKDQTITAYISSIKREFATTKPLGEEFGKVVGDLILQDGVVSGITIKADVIHGKVLVTGEDEIEVEGYGVLPLHEDYRIYKVYGDLAMEKSNGILVGYTVTDFVVSDGMVCAALITEKIKAENIRVVISSSGYQSLYHEKMTFTADSDFVVDDGKNQSSFQAGDEVTVAKGSKLLQRGRIKIVSSSEEGKITLLGLNRNYGVPKYRGSIEIAVTDQGLVVVNELSIEEYLYSVVPSEMPTSYGHEALKVQAVCARSYAFKQLMANKYSNYGAHVDDSVNCQVYNNVEENEASILAVKDTYGQVIMSEGVVLTAYYFSTSCGHTANVEDVWEGSEQTTYLTGTLQADQEIKVDFSNEANFRQFIIADSVEVMQNSTKVTEVLDTYDSGFLMYRWNVKFPVDDLSKQINSYLAKRYNESSTTIFTYVGKVTDEELKAMNVKEQRIVEDMIFVNKPIKSIGTVRDIKVTLRGDSGIVKEMIIVGTDKTILVRYQTTIRTLLAPKDVELVRLDGSTVSGMTLLPSAFCVIDTVTKDGKTTAIKISGGGFGHGVGMSQNGVKAMTQQNKSYDQILQHFYTDASLAMIYD